MKKTAIIFSFNTTNTKKVAEKIQSYFPQAEMVNAENITSDEFLAFENYILGVPTWFDGELPNYWDEFVPAIEDMDLKGKTFAIFGLGNQVEYPENFGDAIGIMAGLLEKQGATVSGATDLEGYTYEKSLAIRNGKFIGLLIDEDTQPELTDSRVENWVKALFA